MPEMVERYHGLHRAPTFEEAISQKLHKIRLPGLSKTDFWNSPAYQGLLNLQQAVETDAACPLYTSPSPRD